MADAAATTADVELEEAVVEEPILEQSEGGSGEEDEALPDLSQSVRPCEAVTLAQLGLSSYLVQDLQATGARRAAASALGQQGAEPPRRSSTTENKLNVAAAVQVFQLTPLEAACQAGHCANVRVLLGELAEHENFSAEHPERAVSLAISSGAEDVLKLLVESRAQVNASRRPRPPLLAAAAEGHIAMVQDLCERADLEINAINARGATALHHAVLQQNLEMTSVLLTHRADPAIADHRGWAPMHVAAHLGNLRIMGQLVEAGASIDGATTAATKALKEASARLSVPHVPPVQRNRSPSKSVEAGHPPPKPNAAAVEASKKSNNIWPPLHLLIARGEAEQIGQLILWKADPCQVGGPDLVTPLMLAISRTSLALQLLGIPAVRAQADYKDRRGQTALHYAVEANAKTVVKGLLDVHASPAIVNQCGQTPLEVGQHSTENSDVVNMLQVEEIVCLVMQRCLSRKQNKLEESEVIRNELRVRGVAVDVQKEKWSIADGTWGFLSTERSRAQAQGGPGAALAR
mmetsp:Transcript_27981/g.64574  ORF Transcript_27981/g.64574 Transcript_27981/m.64574 type:complete len:520 (+) Transcript_27981:57-1616(+)